VEAETGNPESARAVVRAGALLVAHIDTSASPIDSRWRHPPELRRSEIAFGHLQQARCSWIGGHFTEPKEQKTQQSPGFGRSIAPQFVHS
jgi:hypothetical protein